MIVPRRGLRQLVGCQFLVLYPQKKRPKYDGTHPRLSLASRRGFGESDSLDQAGFDRPREDALGEQAGQAAEVAEVESCLLPGVEDSQCSLAEHRAGNHSAGLDM